jgi:hypothetical protein
MSAHPAGLAVSEMAGQLATLANAHAARGTDAAAFYGRLHLLAAPTAGKLVVLRSELAAGTEQRALHHLPRHAHADADLVVGETRELAHDQQLVMTLGQAAKGAAEILQLLLALQDRRRGGSERQQRAPTSGQLGLGVEGDLTVSEGAAMLIDTGVLGDLIDPGLEDDRLICGPQPAQGGDEHLLGHVFGSAVVGDAAMDVGGDPVAIARVELFERPVIPIPGGDDETLF